MDKTNKFDQMETGPRFSDIKPKIRDNLKIRRRGLLMDEALTKTKFGFFNYVLIFVSAMVLNSVVMETCGIGFLLPVSQCDLKLTTSQKGILASVSYIGIIFSSHLWGFLADTKGRRSVIFPTLFVSSLVSIASSFVQNFYQFAILRFLSGFFVSGSSATIYAYLSEFHNNKQRARAIMSCSVLFAIFCNLLPVVVWLVMNEQWEFEVPILDITYKPWRLFIVVCSLPSLLSFVIFIFLPESPKFVLGQGKQAEAYQILQKINRINNGKNSPLDQFEIYEEAESIENRKRIEECKKGRFPFLASVWNQTAPLFRPPYLWPTLLICLIQFCIYITSNGLYMHFADILNKMATNIESYSTTREMMCQTINMRLPQNNETIGELVGQVCITKLAHETVGQSFILEIAYAICLFVIGLLINRVSKFPILFVTLIITGASGLVCVLTNIPLLQNGAFVTLMLSSVAPNIVNAATVEVYPTALRGMAICIALMFSRLGSVFGANGSAILLDDHCETVFYISGCALLGAGFMSYFIPKIHQKTSKSDSEDASYEPRASVLSLR